MKKPILSSKYNLIEITAAEFAVVWYETARSQGLTSKYKTAKLWAINNFEKFIPQALEHLLSMLNRNDISEHVKDEIYSAVMERVNDPTLRETMPIDTLPDIDIKKLLDMTPEAPIVINSKKKQPKTVLHR